MNVQHCAEAIGFVIERVESRIGQRHSVDVAEEHRSRKTELRHRPPQFGD
jgi:hypothetical protein